MRGKKIETLEDLMKAAKERRAVFSGIGALQNPKPAAFVIGWPGRWIHIQLERGLWIYEKNQK